MYTGMNPQSTQEIQEQRRALASQPLNAFHEFSCQTFAAGALAAKVKHLIAVAVAHTAQCRCRFRGHAKAALKAGLCKRRHAVVPCDRGIRLAFQWSLILPSNHMRTGVRRPDLVSARRAGHSGSSFSCSTPQAMPTDVTSAPNAPC